MPALDEEFIKRLRATFKIEAEEHIQSISTMLLEVEKSASGKIPVVAIETAYRDAHSLKGAARAVDFSEIESICQAIEGVFASWKRDLTTPPAASLDALHRSLGQIHELLETSDESAPSEPRKDLISDLAGLPADSGSSNESKISPVASCVAPVAASKPGPCSSSATAPGAPILQKANPPAPTVRISVDKLDAQLIQVQDMLVFKGSAGERVTELRDIAHGIDNWKCEWAKVSVEANVLRQATERQLAAKDNSNALAATSAMIGFLDWNSDYVRSMENRVRSLTARAEQDRHRINKRVDDLLEASKRLLMLPFSTLAVFFPKVIRDLCRDQGKDVELTVEGADVEIDKRILEEMKDPLIHVLRNCIDHGIELPAKRAELNKPARAVVKISVSVVSGNEVEIHVCDDGAGIDVSRVKESAVQHGKISASDAKNISDSDAMDLIFQADVTTSEAVTAISGRGVGMAVVRAQTEKLGGHVSVQSTPDVGTFLMIRLPLTMATFRGVLVSVAGQVFAIPTPNVERVLRVKPSDIKTAENRQVVSVRGNVVSMVKLDAVLGITPQLTAESANRPIYLLLLHSGDQRIAFAVDYVIREEELLVKPLPKPLVRLRNVAGISILGSGKTVPILNVADLLGSARNCGNAAAAPALEHLKVGPKKKILIAEDSITSRLLLKGILESAGYSVRTAVDGMDAFSALREDRFDLVVSDVEMPRLNGFDLTGRIRADKQLSAIPVVLVSALESREQRDRGLECGASAYIVKSSFDQGNLLEAVGRLV